MIDYAKLQNCYNKLVTLDWNCNEGHFKGTKAFLLPDIDVVVSFEVWATIDEYDDITSCDIDIFDIWIVNDLGLRIDVDDDTFEILKDIVKDKIEV